MFPRLRRKRTLYWKAREAFYAAASGKKAASRKVPGPGWWLMFLRMKSGRAARSARWAFGDASRAAGRLRRHADVLLLAIVVSLAGAMLAGAGNAGFLDSLVALLLLVMIMVIYMQLRFQKSMLAQYVPRIAMITITRCAAYSERIRTVNMAGLREKAGQVSRVRYIRVGYRIVNDSFSPVAVDGGTLEVCLRKGGRIRADPRTALLGVGPKRSGAGEMAFRLPKEVDFASIEWVELTLEGNCRKAARAEPVLFINAIIRGKTPELIFEPLGKFRRRAARQRSPLKDL